jgi:isochorismate synthase
VVIAGSCGRDCSRGPSFRLACADETIVTAGVAYRLAASGEALSRAAERRLAETDDGAARIVVGALPFDSRERAQLFQPVSVDRRASRAPAHAPRDLSGSRGLAPLHLRAEPAAEAYRESVAAALARIRARTSTARLEKVVLARSLVVEMAEAIDVDHLVERLSADPSAMTYATPLRARDGGERVLVGATPELLVDKRGARVRSHPLAGSARRSPDASQDRAAADSLRRSEKDAREHALVAEWIGDTLAPFCATLRVPKTPTLTATQTMWHLASDIEGTLRDPSMSSLRLAQLLHPTPAVCGTPRELARETIAALEPFDRGCYAGAVGWCDDTGDGRWLVAIRCAEIAGTTARLFAGAGIVDGSDPQGELLETAAKFGALLRALEIDPCAPALAIPELA